MLTGLRSQFGRFAGFESGANAFLLKPFDSEELVSKVEELLSQSSASSNESNKFKPDHSSHPHKKRLQASPSARRSH
jgi:DNA-binding response OmpR family regulator